MFIHHNQKNVNKIYNRYTVNTMANSVQCTLEQSKLKSTNKRGQMYCLSSSRDNADLLTTH